MTKKGLTVKERKWVRGMGENKEDIKLEKRKCEKREGKRTGEDERGGGVRIRILRKERIMGRNRTRKNYIL